MDSFNEQMDKFGWMIHYVPDAHSNGLANIHTHGLLEKYGHMDLQIVIPIPPSTAGTILHDMVKQIENGKVFKEGELSKNILANDFIVTFKEFTECGRPVLRMLLPDRNNVLPEDNSCEPKYKNQLENIDD